MNISQIKEAVSIEDILYLYGAQINPQNSSLLCPFHDDHRESATIDRKHNRFYCFSCGIHGDVLDVVGQVEHLSLEGSYEWIQSHAAMSTSYNGASQKTLSKGRD